MCMCGVSTCMFCAANVISLDMCIGSCASSYVHDCADGKRCMDIPGSPRVVFLCSLTAECKIAHGTEVTIK